VGGVELILNPPNALEPQLAQVVLLLVLFLDGVTPLHDLVHQFGRKILLLLQLQKIGPVLFAVSM